MAGESRISVFVSHSFSPDTPGVSLAGYRAAVMSAISAAAQSFAVTGVDVAITPVFENHDYTRLLAEQLRATLQSSDCAIVDLSLTSPNVMYELGYLDALGIPVVLLRSKHDSVGVPADIAGRLFVEYEDLNDLVERLPAAFVRCVQDSFARHAILPSDRDAVWFPHAAETINIVVGHSPDNLYSADPLHCNFIYVEQFSDKDALLEVVAFLSRTHLGRVHKYTSRDFPQRQLLSDNLVVVGGPGLEGMNNGNQITVEMHRRVSSRLSYAPDGESAMFARDGSIEQLSPTYADDGSLKTDYGYFAHFPNPFDPKSTVVMAHGMHTTGVLGAVLAFSDRPQSARNFRVLRHALGDGFGRGASFEVLLKVERHAGEVLVPTVDPQDIFWLQT